ncbi:MAG: hypothetical protein V1792_01430 [Pseudomonadota bacterium]
MTSREMAILGQSSNQGLLTAGSVISKVDSPAASFFAGFMTTPSQIHVGYDGLVLPGACVSSFFVYPLRGVEVGGSIPIRLTDRHALRVYGSYFMTDHPLSDQEITWTTFPQGTREWRHSKSQWYKFGGEALYRMPGSTALVGGFRRESLLTNFSDPNPAYLFTIPEMQAQTMVSIYEPYVGVRLQQSRGPDGLSLQLVGFPLLFATIEHLNVCNNRGIPFAHTGKQNTSKGFFAEISAECRVGLFRGTSAAAFVDWSIYQGRCAMTIDRHEGGPSPGVTSATVIWSHYISSLVVGARMETSWSLPDWLLM